MKAIFKDKSISFEFPYVAYSGERNHYPTSLLESAVRAILADAGVSQNIYSNRPKAITPTVNDFVVCNLQGNTEDMAAYGESELYVALFVHDAAGYKNGVKLDMMQSKAMGAMPFGLAIYDDQSHKVAEYEIDDNPSVMGDAADDYDFHARMILFDITTKVL